MEMTVYRQNWPGGSGSLDMQLRRAVWGAMGWPLPCPMGVRELTETMGGTLGRRALEGNGRTSQEVDRRWENGARKAPGGGPYPAGLLALTSATHILYWDRKNSEQRW